MSTTSLIEGSVLLLRENVSGWATDDVGMKQVVPSHPPADLSPSMYPRATVDINRNVTDEVNVTVDKFIEDMVLELTVYSTDEQEMSDFVDNSREAIKDHHQGTDSNGDAYYPNSFFHRPGFVGPIFEENEDKNVTRYLRTFEMEFKTFTDNS